MEENTVGSTGRRWSHWRSAAWGMAVLLLLPLVAMQFTDEVNWSAVCVDASIRNAEDFRAANAVFKTMEI